MGTVELTGLAMMAMRAVGQALAAALARSRTIEALVCGRSRQLLPSSGTSERTHVEEVVAGHSRLAGHSSGDHDDLGSREGLLESVVLRGVADALWERRALARGLKEIGRAHV